MPEEAEVQAAEAKQYDETYVKELRGEAASYRVERNDLKKQVEDLAGQLKGFQDKGKSEVERITEEKAGLERRILDMEREMAEGQVKAKVYAESSKLNLVDPDAAYKLLDLSLIDENPKSVKKALEALVKERPYLVKGSTPPTPGIGGPPVTGGKMTTDQQMLQMFKSGMRK